MAIQWDWTDPSVGYRDGPERRQGIRRASDRCLVVIGALGEWMIHQKRRPVFLVDEHLKVICSNPAAGETLERVGWMRLKESHLEILDSDLRLQLQTALSKWPETRSASVVLTFGRRTIDLTVLQLSHGLPRVFVLEIIQPVERSAISTLLAHSFRLTKVQAKVAVLIYGGGNLKSVAAQLGVTVNTVKTHKREIFQKVGVRSQGELIRKVGEAVARSYIG
jgi:DNA-binding CsgD family transcriptional regulator